MTGLRTSGALFAFAAERRHAALRHSGNDVLVATSGSNNLLLALTGSSSGTLTAESAGSDANVLINQS